MRSSERRSASSFREPPPVSGSGIGPLQRALFFSLGSTGSEKTHYRTQSEKMLCFFIHEYIAYRKNRKHRSAKISSILSVVSILSNFDCLVIIGASKG
jgi:hypothetical protein